MLGAVLGLATRRCSALRLGIHGSVSTSLKGMHGSAPSAAAAAAAHMRVPLAARSRAGWIRAAAPPPPCLDPLYVTTPIYYVNGVPHIGHVYTTLGCDVVARFARLEGREVFFVTGTDEHGQKVQQSADAAGETPQAFADRVSDTFRALLPLYNFSADRFIRTTEAAHKEAAQALWNRLRESGDIYLGAYEGWYSVRDEAFYTEEELVQGMAPTGAPVEWVAEESYFFRLSRFAEPLREHILANPEFISPVSRRNEVISFMREGLRDLSVSRTTFSWGIECPPELDGGEGPKPAEGNQHVMYVWLDALANYLSAIGYPDTSSAHFDKFWPAGLHMVGKDILRFHAIYWPAFLMAAGLPLPKKLFAHGWWMNNGEKMSKSIGNVIDPVALVEKYGTDNVRYFMINEVAFGGDGDFSDRKLVECVNSKLANDLGNLAYRTLSFAYKNCDAQVPTPGELTDADREVLEAADALLPQCRELVDSLALHRFTQALSAMTGLANRYIDVQAPWALKKSDPERMATVLYVLLETLRHVATLSQPVVPTIAEQLLEQLAVPEGNARSFGALSSEGALKGGTPLPQPRIVVPRIEPEVDEEGATAEGVAPSGAAAPGAPPTGEALSDEELAALEASVAAQGSAVRELKDGGAGKEAIGEAVARLLELKSQLPDGHELKGGQKKTKKKSS